jgi:hypothetical protein
MNSITNKSTKTNTQTNIKSNTTYNLTEEQILYPSKYYHTYQQCSNIIDLINNNSNIETKLYKLLEKCFKENTLIFSKFIEFYTHIYNAFRILMTHCSNLNNNTNVGNYGIKDSYNIIKDTINKSDINILNNLINKIINDTQYELSKLRRLYIDISKNKIVNTYYENKKLILRFIEIIKKFNITEICNTIFQPIYMESVKIYSLAHKCIYDAILDEKNNITASVKTLILDELKAARIVLPNIKVLIDLFVNSSSEFVPLIDLHSENINKLIEESKPKL